jgi:hypothetical protein
LLIGWAPQLLKTGVSFNGGDSKYSAASESARATLISKGWTITDAGLGVTTSAKCIPTAIELNEQNEELNIYPNPATDKLSIQLAEKATLVLLNTIGEKVLQTNELGNISLEALPAGVYIYQVKTANKNYTGKIIKE